MTLFATIRDAVSRQHPDGQAPSPLIRAEAVADRDVDELIGIIKGILADGQVVPDEARFLLGWIQTHAVAGRAWPARVLYPRLCAALDDNELSGEEERELLGLLLSAVGGNGPANGIPSVATTLPLCTPAPTIEFADRRFCFTGSCYSGTREWCEQQVITRGGSISSVSKKLDFLVIGEIGSRDWIHSTHGRKIEKAVEFRNAGTRLSIVAEKHWEMHLA